MFNDTAVMLDTNIFDKLLDDDDLLTRLPKKGFKYYATDIQYQQICDISDEKLQKRNEMKTIFFRIIHKKIPPINDQWFNFSTNFNNTRFCSEEESADYKGFCKNKKKNIKDALILLTAKFSGNMIVVSEDIKFPFTEAKKRGYRICTLEEFINLAT